MRDDQLSLKRDINSRQKYPTFQNQFFAQPYISEIVWGIRKKMLKNSTSNIY